MPAGEPGTAGRPNPDFGEYFILGEKALSSGRRPAAPRKTILEGSKAAWTFWKATWGGLRPSCSRPDRAGRSPYGPSKARITRQELWPPNPKALDMATRTRAGRALFGT